MKKTRCAFTYKITCPDGSEVLVNKNRNDFTHAVLVLLPSSNGPQWSVYAVASSGLLAERAFLKCKRNRTDNTVLVVLDTPRFNVEL